MSPHRYAMKTRTQDEKPKRKANCFIAKNQRKVLNAIDNFDVRLSSNNALKLEAVGRERCFLSIRQFVFHFIPCRRVEMNGCIGKESGTRTTETSLLIVGDAQ